MYVDHAATTPVRPEVLQAMLPHLAETWGNPSSLHGPGRKARAVLAEARRTIAEVLDCRPDDVVFTGSGSEGANLAIKGAALAAASLGKRHLVTSRVEHHAVLDTFKWLEKTQGFAVTCLPVDGAGLVDPAELERAVRPDTALVSVMAANNEVGTIQPIPEIVAIAHARGALVHTDAVQAAGTLALDVQALGVDLLSLAGHKIYAPKGVGLLYVRPGVRLSPLVHGGGQERGRRAGTESVPNAVAIAEALRLVQSERTVSEIRLRLLSDRLLDELPRLVPGCAVTGHRTQRLPGHTSFTFEGVEIASVLVGLDRQDVWASSGSACTSQSSEPSHVLRAMGVPRSHLFGALRITFGRENTPADVDTLLAAIPPLVAAARGAAPVPSLVGAA